MRVHALDTREQLKRHRGLLFLGESTGLLENLIDLRHAHGIGDFGPPFQIGERGESNDSCGSWAGGRQTDDVGPAALRDPPAARRLARKRIEKLRDVAAPRFMGLDVPAFAGLLERVLLSVDLAGPVDPSVVNRLQV